MNKPTQADYKIKEQIDKNYVKKEVYMPYTLNFGNHQIIVRQSYN